MALPCRSLDSASFNLGIERLSFQVHIVNILLKYIIKFQSRNREAYLFKSGLETPSHNGYGCGFNLGIERLIFSRGPGYHYNIGKAGSLVSIS